MITLSPAREAEIQRRITELEWRLKQEKELVEGLQDEQLRAAARRRRDEAKAEIYALKRELAK